MAFWKPNINFLSSASSCLKAIRVLQKNGHVPSDPALFKSYAEYGHFVDVRIAALEAVVDYTKGTLPCILTICNTCDVVKCLIITLLILGGSGRAYVNVLIRKADNANVMKMCMLFLSVS